MKPGQIKEDNMALHPLEGSERQPLLGARAVGKADPAERLQVSVFLRSRDGAGLTGFVQGLANRASDDGYLSREEFAQRFGADSADIAAVKNFATAHGLTVVQEHAGQRTVSLLGTVAQFNAAFGVDLQRFEYPGGSYRGRVGTIQLPEELHGAVAAVLGLDNRPAAGRFVRTVPSPANAPPRADAGNSGPPYTPFQIAGFYNFPPGIGQGQCVGLIELQGGATADDLFAYFTALGVNPIPTVTLVSVDGAMNNPGSDPAADLTVMGNIEMVGGIAPRAKIAVYFAPLTDAGVLDGVNAAIHDNVNNPSVISIEVATPESSFTRQFMTTMDSAFQAAAAMGITVCCPSGDQGSNDSGNNGAAQVNFPASSPHVLACGGTTVRDSGAEFVWNDNFGATGGGVSGVFPVPTWQNGLQLTVSTPGSNPVPLPSRGVPDVSANADPNTGYNIRVDGQWFPGTGGTATVVAPLWAGLIARINAARGSRVGFINPHLYASPSALRDIVLGNNRGFAATKGWDACTGLGSPNGAAVAALFGVKGRTN
jgi:kumamolisin